MIGARWAGVTAVNTMMAPLNDFTFDFFQERMRVVERELVKYVQASLMARPGGGEAVAEYVKGLSEGGNNSYRGAEAIMAGYSLLAPYPERDSGGGRHWFVEAGQKSPDRTGRTYDTRFVGVPFYDDTFSLAQMLFLHVMEDEVLGRVFG